MSNNRTNRGVLILMCILALIVGCIYLGRRHPHPLDAETHPNVQTDSVRHIDSVNPDDSAQSSGGRRPKKSRKSKKNNRREKLSAPDLPSPHDSPIEPIR